MARCLLFSFVHLAAWALYLISPFRISSSRIVAILYVVDSAHFADVVVVLRLHCLVIELKQLSRNIALALIDPSKPYSCCGLLSVFSVQSWLSLRLGLVG